MSPIIKVPAGSLSLEAHRGTTVVGEMGTGKTFIAAAAAHMAGFRRILDPRANLMEVMEQQVNLD